MICVIFMAPQCHRARTLSVKWGPVGHPPLILLSSWRNTLANESADHGCIYKYTEVGILERWLPISVLAVLLGIHKVETEPACQNEVT